MSEFFCRIANSIFMQGVSIASGILGFFITILTLLQTHRVSTALRNYQANLNNKKHFGSAFVSLHTTVRGLTEEINSQLQPTNESPVFLLENIPGINDLKTGFHQIQNSFDSGYNWFASLSFLRRNRQIQKLKRFIKDLLTILSKESLSKTNVRQLRDKLLQLDTILEQEMNSKND